METLGTLSCSISEHISALTGHRVIIPPVTPTVLTKHERKTPKFQGWGLGSAQGLVLLLRETQVVFLWLLHSCCATQGEGSHPAPSSPGYFLAAGHKQGWRRTQESHGIAEKKLMGSIFWDKPLTHPDPETTFAVEASQ